LPGWEDNSSCQSASKGGAVYYFDVFSALHAHGVRYLIVGGLAVNLHGVPRMTFDLDIVVDLAPANVGALLDALASLGYVPRLPVPARELTDPLKREAWIRDRNLKAFTFIDPQKATRVVDVLLDHPLDFAAAWASRADMPVEGLSLPTVSRADLITMKDAAGRPQDASDAALLRRSGELEERSEA
jgi:hypothetical protein